MSTRHLDNGLGRILEQFKGKENYEKLLTILLSELDEIEQAQQDIVYQDDINNAVGFQLDIIGENVGLRRQGMTDDEYRLLIRLQIIINTSQGNPDTVIRAWKQLTGSTIADLKEEFPAAISLYSDNGVPSNLILQTVQKIVSATVQINYRFVDGDPFAFAGPTANHKGFGTIDDNSIGGNFVSRVEV